METGDQGQSIQVQGRLGFGLSTLISGRRDRNGGLMESRNHELTRLERMTEADLRVSRNSVRALKFTATSAMTESRAFRRS
jgi:hypothetical protein